MQAYTYFEIQWAYFQPANSQMETKQRKREEKKKKKKEPMTAFRQKVASQLWDPSLKRGKQSAEVSRRLHGWLTLTKVMLLWRLGVQACVWTGASESLISSLLALPSLNTSRPGQSLEGLFINRCSLVWAVEKVEGGGGGYNRQAQVDTAVFNSFPDDRETSSWWWHHNYDVFRKSLPVHTIQYHNTIL